MYLLVKLHIFQIKKSLTHDLKKHHGRETLIINVLTVSLFLMIFQNNIYKGNWVVSPRCWREINLHNLYILDTKRNNKTNNIILKLHRLRVVTLY